MTNTITFNQVQAMTRKELSDTLKQLRTDNPDHPVVGGIKLAGKGATAEKFRAVLCDFYGLTREAMLTDEDRAMQELAQQEAIAANVIVDTLEECEADTASDPVVATIPDNYTPYTLAQYITGIATINRAIFELRESIHWTQIAIDRKLSKMSKACLLYTSPSPRDA